MDLKEYFFGNKKHPAYKETVEMYDSLRVHSDGEYPIKLIDERRPSESDVIKAYRKKIYVPITKEIFNSVFQSLGKIRRSTDWKIDYKEAPARIPENETPYRYFEQNFPTYTSTTYWAFAVGLKQYLIDPNAVVLVMPKNATIQPNEYLKPTPIIFNSPQVYEYIEDEIAILKTYEKVKFKEGKRKEVEADIFLVIDKEKIQKWQKGERSFTMIDEYVHNLGILPCYKLKGITKDNFDSYHIYESRINSIVPRLDEAVREYSDLQAEVVQHVHSEKWTMATQNCTTCTNDLGISTGYIMKAGKRTICHDCNGTGTVATSPYKNIVVRPAKQDLGETPTPIPPAGYIQKQVEIVGIQDKRIEKHLYSALASINMQFLAKVPMSESGIAKEVDRDELNNTVYSIAEDLVSILDNLHRICVEYRYKVIVPNDEERKQLIPSVAVPEKYDLLSSNYLIDEITAARSGKISPLIIAALEADFATKKFYANPELKTELELVMSLDPLIGLNEDEKMTRLANKGITYIDYVISSNIVKFIRRALLDETFVDLGKEQQYNILVGYADEVVKSYEVASFTEDESGNFQPQIGGGNELAKSVGGLTGMIEIVKAVASGVYDLDAAVSMVSQRFGISEEEARKQLGTPQLIQSDQQAEKVAKLT